MKDKIKATVLDLFQKHRGSAFGEEQLWLFTDASSASVHLFKTVLKEMVVEKMLTSLPGHNDVFMLTEDFEKEKEKLEKYIPHHVV